jgi:hypothetical protein
VIRIRTVDVESRARHGERQATLLFALALDVSILIADGNFRTVRIPDEALPFECAGFAAE